MPPKDPFKTYIHKMSEAVRNNTMPSMGEINLLQEELAESDFSYISNKILQHLDKGDQHQQRGEWRSAKKEFEEALKLNVSNPDLHHRLAQLLWESYKVKKDKKSLPRIHQLIENALYYEKRHVPTKKLKREITRHRLGPMITTIATGAVLVLLSYLGITNSLPEGSKETSPVGSAPPVITSREIPIQFNNPQERPLDWTTTQSQITLDNKQWIYQGEGYFLSPSARIQESRIEIRWIAPEGIQLSREERIVKGPFWNNTKIPLSLQVPSGVDPQSLGGVILTVSSWELLSQGKWQERPLGLTTELPPLKGVSLSGKTYWSPLNLGLDAYNLTIIGEITNTGTEPLSQLEGQLLWPGAPEIPEKRMILVRPQGLPLAPGEKVTFSLYREFSFQDYPDRSALPEEIEWKTTEILRP